MGKEKKSWKEQAKKSSEQVEELSNRTDSVINEINACLSKLKSSDRGSSENRSKNPGRFEELVLTSLEQLLRANLQSLKLQSDMKNWLSEFEWMSKKQIWVGMLVSVLITIFVGFIL